MGVDFEEAFEDIAGGTFREQTQDGRVRLWLMVEGDVNLTNRRWTSDDGEVVLEVGHPDEPHHRLNDKPVLKLDGDKLKVIIAWLNERSRRTFSAVRITDETRRYVHVNC